MAERRLEGLVLKVGPLGEHDRLLTLLSEAEGVSRLAVPGARRPKSSLAAAAPLTLLELQVGGRSGLARVRQLRVQRSFSGLGRRLETLAAAQALSDLCLLMGTDDDPITGMLATLMLHLERLEQRAEAPTMVLASTVQGCVHLLSLGGPTDHATWHFKLLLFRQKRCRVPIHFLRPSRSLRCRTIHRDIGQVRLLRCCCGRCGRYRFGRQIVPCFRKQASRGVGARGLSTIVLIGK